MTIMTHGVTQAAIPLSELHHCDWWFPPAQPPPQLYLDWSAPSSSLPVDWLSPCMFPPATHDTWRDDDKYAALRRQMPWSIRTVLPDRRAKIFWSDTALHCIKLHCSAVHCSALHCTALQWTAVYCSSLERGCRVWLITPSYRVRGCCTISGGTARTLGTASLHLAVCTV